MMKLLVYWDHILKETIQLTGCVGKILGSGDDAHVNLGVTGVSRLHCMVEADADGTVSIRDLGSRNGTKVNGRKITEPMPLKPGDLIQVGATTIVCV